MQQGNELLNKPERAYRICLHSLKSFVRWCWEDEIDWRRIDHLWLNDHNELLGEKGKSSFAFEISCHEIIVPESLVRITNIDIIVLHPSRNISRVSEVFISSESFFLAFFDTVVVFVFFSLLSILAEWCLNHTIDRSNNLRK